MKKAILLICLFCSYFCNAQKIHFTDTTNVWKEEMCLYNDGLPPPFYYYTYTFVNDSTIGTVEYRNFSFGTVREDTILRKVFLLDIDTEIVLMDYNLVTGDTFRINSTFTGNHKYVVISTDSTQINTVWHKVWHFSKNLIGSPMDLCDVIEGIGCVRHPIHMLMLSGLVEPPDEHMYCFSNKGITPTLSPPVSFFDNIGSCSYFPHLSNSDLRIHRSEIQITPNPATSTLTITSTEKITTLTIANTLGLTVFTQEYNAETVQVDVANLPTGLYFVKVNGAAVRKFVKD